MVDLTLSLGCTVLILRSDKESWCSILLKNANETVNLGGEDQSLFLSRLYDVLENGPGNIIGKIDNIDVCWITSLSEGHCSFYAGNFDDYLYIFIQSKDGEIVAKSKLHTKEVKRLTEEIKRFKDQ